MSEKKSWGQTVLGWFIVQDGAQAADRGSETPAGASGVTAGPVVPGVFQHDPPAAPGGQVDFDAVFEAAGIDSDERQRVNRATELLGSLPEETPVGVRRQIVEASLKAFGVPIEQIIEAGVSEIQALEGYIRAGAADTQQLLEESARRIQQYEEEIRQIRQVMDARVKEQQGVTAACNARKLEVQRVLEFFGQERVAQVVQASPRLIDPSGPGGSSN